jgi:alpha-N-acetylglucosamine transferase
MSIRYHPVDLLKKIAPKKKIDKLVSSKLTLNKAALSFITDIDFLSAKAIERVALKTIKEYKAKYQEDIQDGASPDAAKEDAVNDNKQLVNRVQNTIVNQVAGEIKDQYLGEYYKWLPSDAETPDPIHQLNYGETFQIGDGEMPGDRIGCRCGMFILVPETKLEL